ncbi:MAG: hypothetical protein IT348_19435, partial [Candidatus Eisenbacteria bacterium]|nr:hypothetical protein [Candidatus Eisenbacteria bacterium]
MAGLKRARDMMRGFSKSAIDMGTTLLKAGAATTALGTAAVVGIGKMVKDFADAGSELVDMSARTGASVEALSELGYAAQQSGTSAASLEGGL